MLSALVPLRRASPLHLLPRRTLHSNSSLSNRSGTTTGTAPVQPKKGFLKKAKDTWTSIDSFEKLETQVNRLTAYNKITKLVEAVGRSDENFTACKVRAKKLKADYDTVMEQRAKCQADANSLLQRKESWIDNEWQTYQKLTQQEWALRQQERSMKEEVVRAENEVDKSLTGFMDSLRARYHEEYVWSMKIRSVQTNWYLVALAIQIGVYLGSQFILVPLRSYRQEERLGVLVQSFQEHNEQQRAELEREARARMQVLEARLEALSNDTGASAGTVPVALAPQQTDDRNASLSDPETEFLPGFLWGGASGITLAAVLTVLMNLRP